MTGPHPLNQAVIAQALHDLRNGQLRRCLSMGFDECDLEALKSPGLVSVLLNARVSWCSVTINRDVLRRLLHQIDNVEQEVASIDRMLRLGASTRMVNQFYGLSHQEVALRREILGLPKRKGRRPVLNDDQDATVWARWKSESRARSLAMNDDPDMLGLALDLAEEMSLPVSVIWAAIRNWIAQGMT